MDLLESFGSILESAFFERLLHGQIRPGFVLGMGIMFVSAIMTCLWYMTHPDVNSYISMSGFAFCFGVGLIGSLVQLNTDIDDQEAGRYSKMGSGWNLWEDNIVFNKLGQMVLTLTIVVCFGASAYLYVESAHHDAALKLARVPSKTGSPAGTHATTHSSTHSNSTAHHHKVEKKAHS